MKIKANGKLNLFLNIERKLPNGYHNLETIITPIDLYDIIYVEPINKDKIIISTNDNTIPVDERNSLFKCATLFKKEFKITDGLKVHLNKQIPLSAGLGGESTDAAALMKFYNDYYKLGLSVSDIFYYGRMLSWDVPICYMKKCTYISDDKDICRYMDLRSHYYILLVQPDYGILTSDAFKEIDKKELQHKSPQTLLKKLAKGNPLDEGLYNCFIFANNYLLNEYNELFDYSKSLSFDSISMSGTGSCFFLVTNNYDIAQKGLIDLSKKYKYVKIVKTI